MLTVNHHLAGGQHCVCSALSGPCHVSLFGMVHLVRFNIFVAKYDMRLTGLVTHGSLIKLNS